MCHRCVSAPTNVQGCWCPLEGKKDPTTRKGAQSLAANITPPQGVPRGALPGLSGVPGRRPVEPPRRWCGGGEPAFGRSGHTPASRPSIATLNHGDRRPGSCWQCTLFLLRTSVAGWVYVGVWMCVCVCVWGGRQGRLHHWPDPGDVGGRVGPHWCREP